MPDTSYTLTFEDRGDYLFAHLTGEDSFADSLSYWNEIADQIIELGHRKLLLHETLVGEVSEGEIFDIMMDLRSSGLVEIKIALYDENREDTPINALGQLIANNRGATVKLFKTLQSAQRWIEQDDD
jgi:hypothetical protein